MHIFLWCHDMDSHYEEATLWLPWECNFLVSYYKWGFATITFGTMQLTVLCLYLWRLCIDFSQITIHNWHIHMSCWSKSKQVKVNCCQCFMLNILELYFWWKFDVCLICCMWTWFRTCLLRVSSTTILEFEAIWFCGGTWKNKPLLYYRGGPISLRVLSMYAFINLYLTRKKIAFSKS